MEIHNLPKTTEKKLRRLGRGHGTGRGKTAGRGTKGQKARGKILLSFEGGALPLVKRLPFLRGRGRNKVVKRHPVAINIAKLTSLPAKTTVDVETLIKYGIVRPEAKKSGVKIIGNSKLGIAYDVKVPVTSAVRRIITRAGGKVL
jgi:large subunit ribosomal protein L15